MRDEPVEGFGSGVYHELWASRRWVQKPAVRVQGQDGEDENPTE